MPNRRKRTTARSQVSTRIVFEIFPTKYIVSELRHRSIGRAKVEPYEAKDVWVERIVGLAANLNERYDRCGSVPDRSQPQRRRRREIDGNVLRNVVHRIFVLWFIS